MRRVNCGIYDVGTAGEVGANFSLQLSSRTQFTKINNKKVIAENQCEKHKKSSLEAHVGQSCLKDIKMAIIAAILALNSQGTKAEKMLTLAPERYTAGFCMVAMVILWCI